MSLGIKGVIQMETIIQYLLNMAQSYPQAVLVVSILGTLDVIGTFIVKTTTTLSDDAWLAKLQEHKIWGPVLKALEKFSYFDLKK